MATLALIAYFIRNESWAPWLYGGFAFGFGIMTIMIGRFAYAYRRKKGEAGKANAV